METHRSSIINKIIEKYSLINPYYLEIGVHKANTFLKVNSINKDGVDPEQYCICEHVNYKMTSDVFFKNNNKKYDIIFIDGLHTAYQVSKDIYNSIKNINDEGWIVLDDVYPHCEYEQERLDLRKNASQTGDIWKVLYNSLDDIINMSQDLYFDKSTQRGSFVFRLKKGNDKNITVDENIPTCNTDGFYIGNDAEWNKYTYKNDFQAYLERLNNFNSILISYT